jgi:hypothetical protein
MLELGIVDILVPRRIHIIHQNTRRMILARVRVSMCIRMMVYFELVVKVSIALMVNSRRVRDLIMVFNLIR